MMTDAELLEHLDKVSADFSGDLTQLSGAIGAVWFGRFYGWRVLRIITTSKVYTRHQKILGLDFKDVMEATTKYSNKSVGYNFVIEAGKFWETVRGTYPIDFAKRVHSK